METCKGGKLHECGPDALDSVLVEACKYGCEDGRCRDAALCEEGTADCDDAPDCETDTTSSAKHCGACGNACDGEPHTTGACADGGCACAEGYGDCTDAAGCETPTLDDVDNCGACGNVCLSGECVKGHCSTRAFVSSVGFTGNLGGLAGADEKCQALADASELGGTFRAWLSDSVSHVSMRFPHSPAPYRQLDGSLLAANWSDLTQPARPLETPLVIDETGAELDEGILYVWTGGGSKTGDLDFCRDWTAVTNLDYGTLAAARYANYWDSSGRAPCLQSAALFCFEVNRAE